MLFARRRLRTDTEALVMGHIEVVYNRRTQSPSPPLYVQNSLSAFAKLPSSIPFCCTCYANPSHDFCLLYHTADPPLAYLQVPSPTWRRWYVMSESEPKDLDSYSQMWLPQTFLRRVTEKFGYLRPLDPSCCETCPSKQSLYNKLVN